MEDDFQEKEELNLGELGEVMEKVREFQTLKRV